MPDSCPVSFVSHLKLCVCRVPFIHIQRQFPEACLYYFHIFKLEDKDWLSPVQNLNSSKHRTHSTGGHAVILVGT